MSQHRAVYPRGLSADEIPLKLSPGVASNGHLFVTGMTGSGPDGSMPETPDAQFQAVFEKISGVLAAETLDFSHVVEMTSYHIDIQRHFEAFQSVHAAFVRAPYPAWTAVGVAALRRQGALVEVKVTARLKDVR